MKLTPETIHERWEELQEALRGVPCKFWQCPDHTGAPHTVTWTGDMARCDTLRAEEWG